jgi:prephenate dehydratase
MSKFKIAIQGIEGSFHHAAAKKYFGKNTDVFICTSFREVVQHVANQSDIGAGVLAIENSNAGSILPNYLLLEKNSVQIVGEINLKISQNLLVNPGTELVQIKEVHSHPMALQQCSEYLSNHKWKLIESQDTAFSAAFIKKSPKKGMACIASNFAANLFELTSLKNNIQNEKYNLTRFLILQKDYQSVIDGSENKASIIFWVPHKKGSLSQVLSIFKKYQINLSKIQSVAIPGSHFLYSFHADLEFNKLRQFELAMLQLKKIATKLKIYGLYHRNDKIYIS